MGEKQRNRVLGNLVSHQSEFSKLSIEDVQWVLQNSKEAVGLFVKAIKNRERQLERFPIWKIIKLGTNLESADEFYSAFSREGIKVGDYFQDVMSKVTFTAKETQTEIFLVVVSGRDLGFKNSFSRSDFYDRASSFGLKIVPAEVGPQLRIQYMNQPLADSLFIAMKSIKDHLGGDNIFIVRHDSTGFWLRTYCDGPTEFFDLDSRWVFTLRGLS